MRGLMVRPGTKLAVEKALTQMGGKVINFAISKTGLEVQAVRSSRPGKLDELARDVFEGDQLRPIWRFLLSVVVLFASFSLTAEIVGIGFAVANVHPSMAVASFGAHWWGWSCCSPHSR